jgi:hypothetical protein
LPEPEIPTFGSYCKATAQAGQTTVVGLIHNIDIQDDEFTRQLAVSDQLTPEQLADSRENRLIPIEIGCLIIGYIQSETVYHELPPQPPITLTQIFSMTSSEVDGFTQSLTFIPLILQGQNLPIDSLLAMALLGAAQTKAEGSRRGFLMQAGRFCARHLAGDLTRIERLVRKIESSEEGYP